MNETLTPSSTPSLRANGSHGTMRPGDGDQAIQHAVEHLSGRAAVHQDAFLEAIEADVYAPLRASFVEAAQVHDELLASVGWTEETLAPATPEQAWQALRSYLYGAREKVLEPVRHSLETVDAGRVVAERWDTLVLAFAAEADGLPEVMARQEPAVLFAPDPADTAMTRMRKGRVRSQRAWAERRRRLGNMLGRLARRPEQPAPVREQHVPLLPLSAYHLQVRLPEALRPVRQQVGQHLARSIARLERAVAAWAQGLLEAEVEAERPAFYIGEAEEAPGAEVPATVREKALAFGHLLAELAELHLPEAAVEAAQTVGQEVGQAFVRDVETAGTFQLDLAERTTEDVPAISARAKAEGDAWTRWHRQAAARLALNESLITFRETTQALAARQVNEIDAEGESPVRAWVGASAAVLGALHDEAVARCDEASGGDGVKALEAALQEILGRAAAGIDKLLLDPFMHEGIAEKVQGTSDAGVGRLIETLAALPTGFKVHPLPETEEDEAIDPNVDEREVRVHDLAEQAHDALLVERLRTAVQPITEALAEIQAGASEVPTILRFNMEAALEELDHALSGEEEGPVAIASARELALNGLSRSSVAIEGLLEAFEGSQLKVAEAVTGAYRRGWSRMHERVRQEGRVQKQLLDVRSRMMAQAHELGQRAATLAGQGRDTSLRLLRLGRRRASALVQLGQSAVGAGQVAEEDVQRTLEAILNTNALLERFPLVYRRLFSFDPVTDPTLLEHRRPELDALARHLERWRRRLAGTLLLTGYFGNGITSLLNVSQQTVLRDVRLYTLDLEQRLVGEPELVRRIAEGLGLVDKLPAGEVWSFEQLGDALAQSDGTDRPEVFLIEHLEHLLLRHVGGTQLLGRLLGFMSRTDVQVMWLATIGEQGWQFIQKAAPVPASLVTVLPLMMLDRAAIEALILNRHRRSGLPLVFEEPDDLNPLQRRRLRRARTERERQQMLQQLYFDGLFRACGQSIMLALFYWLHSVQLDVEASTVHVQPLRPFSFAFLGRYPLSHAFALRAFLQHGSLTVEEHARVFQVSPEESYQTFEALYNDLLIAPYDELVGRRSGSTSRTAVEVGRRYRVRALIVHPVQQYLRDKNIIH